MPNDIILHSKQEACESYVFKIIRFSSYYEIKAFTVTPWCNGYVDLQELSFTCISFLVFCFVCFNLVISI